MSKLKKTKIVYLMIVVGLMAGGVSLIWQLANQTDSKDVLAALGQQIYFTYTDDNSGEDLIIKSDKKNYDGFNQDIVYFNITNTRRKTELVDLQVHFDNDQASVADIAKWDQASHNWASLADQPLVLLEEDSSSLPGVVQGDEAAISWYKRLFHQIASFLSVAGNDSKDETESLLRNLVTKKRTEYLMAAKETAYFKMAINYPALSQGEFYIEAQGNQGGYGLLDPWYNSNWLYRKRITIEADQVATTTDSARFPVLATTTDSDLASHARSDAYDIVFTSSDGQTTLDYEREKWDSATGEIVAWIQADISSTTDTVLYMYYGNSGQSTDSATTTGVWEDSYKGAWHLAHDGTATTTYPDFLDSTKNDNDGSSKNMNSADLVDGQANGGLDFDGSDDYVDVSGLIDDIQSGPATVSLWFIPYEDYDTSHPMRMLFSLSDFESSNDIQIYAYLDNPELTFKIGVEKNLSTSGVTFTAGNWYHAVGTYDGSSAMKIYVNGILRGSLTDASREPPYSLEASLGHWVDVPDYEYPFNGLIDEVRISNTTRSAQWIDTEYNNQSAVSEFLTFGAEEDNTPTEFVSTIQQSGGDYNSLSTWEDAVECNLTATSTRVFSGSLAGTLDENDTVALYRGGVSQNATSTVVATTSSQILVDGIIGDISDGLIAQSGDLWRKDGSNYWTITGATNDELGNTAIAIAKIDGAWSSADQTAVTITGWTTSATNYIRIYTTTAARHNGKWDTSKYRLYTSDAARTLLIYEAYIKLEGLQLGNAWSSGEVIIELFDDLNDLSINKCIFWANHANVYMCIKDNATSLGTIKIWNSVFHMISTENDDAIHGFKGTWYIYNCTAHVPWVAFRARNAAVTMNIKNCLVAGSGYSFYADAGTYNVEYCASNDDKADDYEGDGNRINQTFLFTDEANDDFHLMLSDTGARDAGVNLSGDSNLAFDDDIDGQSRPGRGVWDIGADEVKAATRINTPITQKYTDGLVGHWTFNGEDMDWASTTAEALDRSGNNNNGNVTNFGQEGAVIGQVGQALEFDGGNDSVDINHNSLIDFDSVDPFSIFLWTKTVEASTDYGPLINKFNSSYRGYFVQRGVGTPLPKSVFSAGLISVYGSQDLAAHGITTINDGNWHLVGFTWNGSGDASGLLLYADGGLESKTVTRNTLGTAPIQVTNPLAIGRELTNVYYDGVIDEVRVYDRVLSADEITDLYQAGARKLGVNTPITQKYTSGLVGHWTFNGQDMDWASTTAEALDRSGNSNNGNVTNFGQEGAVIGQVGQALEFDGSDDYVDAGDVYDGVKTVAFWIKADGTTDPEYFDGQLDEVRFYDQTLNSDQIGQLYRAGARRMKLGAYSSSPLSSASPSSQIIDLNGTANIEVSSGTITANGFTDSTIYVDGSAASTIDSDWRFVAITTNTGIDASAVDIGKVASAAWACGDTLTYCGDNYTTVQMTATYGSQCWLGENLRTIYKPNCVTGITNYCDPAGCGSPWGRLYDWDTIMNGATTATDCGAKIQGICPSGWHIPSDYASCPSDDFPGLGTDGGALKDTGIPPWTSPNTGATNASNWTGYPAGYYSGGSYYNRANNGYFWSSAQYDASDAWSRILSYDSAAFVQYYGDKPLGFSVRCVKD